MHNLMREENQMKEFAYSFVLNNFQLHNCSLSNRPLQTIRILWYLKLYNILRLLKNKTFTYFYHNYLLSQ